MAIANDELARNQDRVAAFREIREAHKDMFEKLFDAGVSSANSEHWTSRSQHAATGGAQQAIRAVFQNWGLLTSREDEPAEQPPSP
jgi:hypothetical protein